MGLLFGPTGIKEGPHASRRAAGAGPFLASRGKAGSRLGFLAGILFFLGALACSSGGSGGGGPLPGASDTVPVITGQPSDQEARSGESATFTVTASGSPEPTFTWERSEDGGTTWVPLSGANTATYIFTTRIADHDARFRAKAANVAGTATSSPARLAVTATPLTIQIPDTLNPEGHEPLELMPIAAGTFTMGQATVAEPTHSVILSQAFYMAKFECTQAQWQAVTASNPSHSTGARRPVENVSYGDAEAFLAMLNTATTSQRPAGMAFRLPTEAEWEYACRAGGGTLYPHGNDPASLGDYAWFEENSGDATYEVGQRQANDWGLHDMNGNVQEWCQDWFDTYRDQAETDPVGPGTGSTRVIRGGGYSSDADACRSAYRYGRGPGGTDQSVGFRVVLAAPTAEPQIFIVGGYYTDAALTNLLPCQWRNGGNLSQLSSSPGTAQAVTYTDETLYIVGDSGPSACFWVNGMRTALDGTHASALSTSAGMLFTAGAAPLAANPCYWTAASRTDLPAGSSYATAIWATGGSVYTAGAADMAGRYSPCYWDNTTQHLLSSSSGSSMGIHVENGTVIVAGYYYDAANGNLATPCVWTNGTAQKLDVGGAFSAYHNYVTGLSCYGGTAYVSGFVRNGAAFTPCYWSGTTQHILEGAAGGKATGIYVLNGKVYVCGYYGGCPCYWVDGVRHDLPHLFGGYANGIFVM